MWSSRSQDLALGEIDLVNLSLDLGICILGFSHGSDSKESTCKAGNLAWVGKIPWRRAWQLTPVFLSREFHGQRSLVGYSPWGHRVRQDWATNTFTLKNTGVGCLSLLQGIFSTQGLKPGLLRCRQILHRLSHQRGPNTYVQIQTKQSV